MLEQPNNPLWKSRFCFPNLWQYFSIHSGESSFTFVVSKLFYNKYSSTKRWRDLFWIFMFFLCFYAFLCFFYVFYVFVFFGLLRFFSILLFCTNSWCPSVFCTFYVFYVFLFRNGCGRSRFTCMQNLGLIAQKLSELWSFLCFLCFLRFFVQKCLRAVKICDQPTSP